MSDMETIGGRVRELRERSGHSQEELAEQLGLNKSQISRVENGQRGLAVQELMVIAPFLGVSFDDILLGETRDTVLLRGEGDASDAAAYADRVISDFEYLIALGL